jgi:hypothetical protein
MLTLQGFCLLCYVPVKLPDTRVSSIVCFTILVLPVLLDEEYWSFQYCVFYNTSITSIVCFTILVLPVLLDEEYWTFQYCNVTILVIPVLYIYNTGCTSIVHLQYWNTRIGDLYTIPEAPVFFIQQYW